MMWLALVDLVLRPACKNLFFPPARDIFECLAVDEIQKRLLVGPLTGDQIRGIIAHVFPERRTRVAFGRTQSAHHCSELLLKIRLLAHNDAVIHADSNHRKRTPDRLKWSANRSSTTK